MSSLGFRMCPFIERVINILIVIFFHSFPCLIIAVKNDEAQMTVRLRPFSCLLIICLFLRAPLKGAFGKITGSARLEPLQKILPKLNFHILVTRITIKIDDHHIDDACVMVKTLSSKILADITITILMPTPTTNFGNFYRSGERIQRSGNRSQKRKLGNGIKYFEISFT